MLKEADSHHVQEISESSEVLDTPAISSVIGACSPLCGHALGKLLSTGPSWSLQARAKEEEEETHSQVQQHPGVKNPPAPSFAQAASSSRRAISETANSKYGQDTGYLLGIGLFGALIEMIIPGESAA